MWTPGRTIAMQKANGAKQTRPPVITWPTFMNSCTVYISQLTAAFYPDTRRLHQSEEELFLWCQPVGLTGTTVCFLVVFDLTCFSSCLSPHLFPRCWESIGRNSCWISDRRVGWGGSSALQCELCFSGASRCFNIAHLSVRSLMDCTWTQVLEHVDAF